MALHRPCGNPSCSNKTRVKYVYCTTCRANKTTTVTVPDAVIVHPPSPHEQIGEDRQRIRAAGELASLKARYKESLNTIDTLEQQLRATNVLRQSVDVFEITPRMGSGTSEATPVVVLSDWHVEELVGSEVGGLNRYTPEIATERATTCFQAALRLVRLLQQDVTINTVVLALLGDFITGNIHGEETAEKNELTPTHAIVHAQNLLISGIEFLLNNSTLDFIVPCHSGNHARTTQKTRFGSENGHSLEYLMYLHLAAYFRNEPRLTFIIPDGMHSYIDIYGHILRFHHGHAVKYGGGVGGIYIPVKKAIAQWNKGRAAALDVFGHFHQLRDGGDFICNGSMIGYNAFALSIKADYEPPKQALFLMDKKRGRTAMWPIVFKR